MGAGAIWSYFSRFFIFLLYLALALRARANKSVYEVETVKPIMIE